MTQHIRLLGALALTGLAACAAAPAPEEPAPPPPPPSPAEGSCLAAVVASTGVGGITVLRSEASAEGTVVFVNVPGSAAPWSCQVSPDGQVSAVTDTAAQAETL